MTETLTSARAAAFLLRYEAGGRFFREPILPSTDLREQNLSGIEFRGGSFAGSDLFAASLYQATITGTDFSHANLVSCDLSRSHISLSHFVGAHLNQARIRYSQLLEVECAGPASPMQICATAP